MSIIITQALSQSDKESCLTVRRRVFIENQDVPELDDIDGLDEICEHYLLKIDQLPVGAARIRYLNNYAKIERVAILDNYQGQGLGKKLMKYLINKITNTQKLDKILISSQIHAIVFYENLGFIVCSKEYLDSGIIHKDMQMSLTRKI